MVLPSLVPLLLLGRSMLPPLPTTATARGRFVLTLNGLTRCWTQADLEIGLSSETPTNHLALHSRLNCKGRREANDSDYRKEGCGASACQRFAHLSWMIQYFCSNFTKLVIE
ncbi:uncharacterized protein [Miscanthus floridulus]|uniref:uncharacterized protein n=1 Tax=Miscanthus floridulus TaxID=154761 RepID=UPI00345A52F3